MAAESWSSAGRSAATNGQQRKPSSPAFTMQAELDKLRQRLKKEREQSDREQVARRKEKKQKKAADLPTTSPCVCVHRPR